MLFRIDLKIFAFLILFYFTRQIEIYATILIFCIIHELGHLLAGLILKMKPKKIEIMPLGISISFYLQTKDYNKNYKILYNYSGNPYNYNVETLKGELLCDSKFDINSSKFVIRYQHLSYFELELNGKHVKRGTIIGKTGVTGAGKYNRGPHLHFEIRKQDRLVDPKLILEI